MPAIKIELTQDEMVKAKYLCMLVKIDPKKLAYAAFRDQLMKIEKFIAEEQAKLTEAKIKSLEIEGHDANGSPVI